MERIVDQYNYATEGHAILPSFLKGGTAPLKADASK
jgi:hypothetical protein